MKPIKSLINILVMLIVLVIMLAFIKKETAADLQEPILEYIVETDTIWDTVTILPKLDSIYTNKTRYIHYVAEEHPDTVNILTGEYHPPAFGGQDVSGYGWRWGRMHHGVDISRNNRDTSYSIYDGVVRYSRKGWNGGYGNIVIVRHHNGLESYYAHHWSLLVEEGDTVKAGTPLGIIGSTGRSSGPHLHFEVRFLGLSMDPDPLFDEGSYLSNITLIRDRSNYSIQ